MNESRRNFLAVIGCAGLVFPILPQIIGSNIAPFVPETPTFIKALKNLQIGMPRPRVDQWYAAKSLDGERTKIGMEDLGECLTALDTEGNAYRAYTSYFECGGQYIFSPTDYEFCKLSKSGPMQFRMQEDRAAIEALGVDPDSIEFT
jgi:hypothetical protein